VESALPRSSGGISSSTIPNGSGPLAERVQAFEREVILAELKRSHNNMSMAAKSLGLERSHLYKKAEQLGIDVRAIRREQGAQD
jgi:DNA-binding NtrC family response regulator